MNPITQYVKINAFNRLYRYNTYNYRLSAIYLKCNRLKTHLNHVLIKNKVTKPKSIKIMKTGIIIPSYNEEKRLNVNAFVNFINTHPDYHLCFVNDGSKDKTIDVLKTIYNQNKTQVSIIDLKQNSGKAEAVRTGALYLYNREDIEFVSFIDADLSTDFNDLKDLVKTLKNDSNLDLVYGSRGKGEGEIERNPFRNLMSKIIKSIIYLILRLPIADTQCGAKVFRRSIVPVAYKKAFISRWLFDVEIFIRLKNHYGSKQQTIKATFEQALNRWVHVDDSRLGVKDALNIPFKLVSIWVSYNFTHPSLSLNISPNQLISNPI